MKLSLAQIERVEEQYDGQIVPDDHAVSPQLESQFGDHTFFLDSEGLNIVEPSPGDGRMGNVVNLASWTDEKCTTLALHPPQPTPLMVEIGDADDDELED
jgi:hypothetical protein